MTDGATAESGPETNPETAEVLTRVDNGVGLITLNRPKAINSLNQTMVDALGPLLTRWAADDAVHAVVLSGAGERGLCAGGDVVAVYHSARKDGVEVRKFWRDEYLLNGQIGRFPKPYVALMDGIVMGGGVGVSAHGNVRVVTETSKVAMPEVGIGFVPDVGGAFILSRAPGALGLYAALSGATLSGSDAITLGLADHYLPHSELAAFTAAIVSDGVESAVAAHVTEPPPSQLAAQREWIDECFAGETVVDIVAALRDHAAGPANDAAKLISSRSPIAVSVTLQAMRRAAKLDTLEDVLVQDYRVSSVAARSHDLVEGIRAQIIDKDRNPKWSPASLDQVTAAAVDAYFVPVDDDLRF
ncbi:enoyl-CoA hydratase/isomerase family protein [Mycobacterium shigaense]|uniref:3-hydroxyisobutyryl-CoA hydrolase n=1 Tax=Mycobacterium shigaense TaxID=722731 RepID=A0A1Z4EMB0_9MYCO|nr:enoyl-CoA hydratase/isomerase family protein [Mycobacterium shigaense]PRI13103.1 3-hydroxyisobutyryl-CoA hydrolase [Mycobacterium shigaense]BAX94078.1 3-hydroxyisobutyryl-CoA hydrolase [Mycobacterium shigaense]